MYAYAITIFLSAFLLFQVQPMIARFILPWFGGSPAVWTTCMLFFQVLLLAGYAYADWSVRKLTTSRQVAAQIGILLLAIVLLPIAPDPSWKPSADRDPTLWILLLLISAVGVPYLVLATSAPLLQAWFARQFAEMSPYRLYALSNAGSLLGLVSYPFVVEPTLTLQYQSGFWSALFVLYGLCFAGCGALLLRAGATPTSEQGLSITQTPGVLHMARVLGRDVIGLLRAVWRMHQAVNRGIIGYGVVIAEK